MWIYVPFRVPAPDSHIMKLTDIGVLFKPVIQTTKVKDVLFTLKPKFKKHFSQM